MSENKSFLASVKDQLSECFADTFDQVASEFGESVPEVIPEALKKLQKRTWEIVEKRLKESYLNGRKAGNGKLPPEERRPRDPRNIPDSPNPFRKR